MADVKISALPAATTPLAGTEVLPIVQSATTRQVAVADLTAGRAMSATSLTLTTPLSVANGGSGLSSITANYIPYATATNTLGTSANFQYNGTVFAIGGVLNSWAIPTIQFSRGSFFADTGSIGLQHNAYFDGSWKYIAGSQGALQMQFVPSDGIYWQTAPSGTAGAALSWTQTMKLTAAGELLLGTSSVSTLLTVNGIATLCSGTATPAGGSTSARLIFGTTAGFGIYYGSGAPTVSAAQGSIYLRSDGSSTSTRLYVNTNGSTTWTNVTTAA